MNVQLFTRINSSENTYFSEPILYYTHRHLATGKYDIVYSYLLSVTNAPNTFAIIHFVVDNTGHWSSLPKAPFGGICQSGSLTAENLIFLLNCIVDHGSTNGCHCFTVSSPPAFYDDPPYTSEAAAAFRETGFNVPRIDQYHAIPITDKPFDFHLAPAELRRLNKSKRAGMIARRTDNFDSEVLYRIMKEWHQACEYTLSFSESGFYDLLTNCSNDVFVFQVTFVERPVALGIVIRVNTNVLYHFLPAWDRNFRIYSPIVLLTEAIYNYGRENGFRWLDLGRSLDQNGRKKTSLMRFKERIGGIEFPRIVWSKNF